MVYKAYEPDKDAGWGLIFRLNALWEMSDRRALSGDYDKWELVLDRIFSNLLYRQEIKTKKNGNDEIVDVEISQIDKEVFDRVKAKIRGAKKNAMAALKSNDKAEFRKEKENHYRAIMLYDVWLRKFMQSLGLYLKEIEHNPSKALFGR